MYGSVRGARGNSRPYRDRRELITLVGGAAVWAFAARAQQDSRVVGVLMAEPEHDPESRRGSIVLKNEGGAGL
jgi:hypothetical protein